MSRIHLTVAACLWAASAFASAQIGVSPLEVNFGTVPIHAGAIGKVVIVNTGDETATLNVNLPTVHSPFGIMRGGGLVQLEPGGRHVVWLSFFARETAGSDVLFIAPEAPLVRLRARLGSSPGCAVAALPVDFDQLLPGETRSFPVAIGNNSSSEHLLVRPFSDDPAFSCAPAGLNVPPGGSLNLTVTYAPVEVGPHAGSILLGPDFCQPVTVRGECISPTARTEDVVGIWWDPTLTEGVTEDPAVGRPFTAWLAMLNPTEPAGVAGWELKLALDPQTLISGVTLQGLAYNILDAPSFFVGLAEPLPWAPQVTLASLDLVVFDDVWHEVGLRPIDRPSLNGRMAWAHGADYALKPLYPTTGGPVVAWFRAAAPVATETPSPVPAVADGRVVLRWRLPGADADGCHVHRRVDGTEKRLTAAPLPATDGAYVFVDDLAGLRAGATAAYSYAVLRGGVEIARSPEVTVDLPGAGVARSGLLPNRPNPFNPETEIHFALARGGHLRLAVFDVSGRRVAVLEDGQRAAGPHHVTWNGRDQAGRSLPSGAYYVQLESDTGRDTRKIMLLK